MGSRRWLLVFAALWGWTSAAEAHFLFIRIGPAAEGGRTAEVYFSEQAEAGDPRFVGKIGGTKLWAQTAPGTFVPLTVRPEADRLQAHLPAVDRGGMAVVGVCEYGVLARPQQVPFLLRYYPKAIAGRPDVLNVLRRQGEIPLEIMATIEGNHMRLAVLRDGKPMEKAVLHSVDADLTETTITAGSDGWATWTPPAPGMYSIYARDDIKRSGTAGGQAYDEIREFATLALDWPLQPPSADPEAVALFEQALAARAQWKDFPGFSADLAGETEGRPFSGSLRVLADGTVEVKTDDAVARSWLEDQFESMVMHRRVDESAGARPRPALRFADDRDDHPLGRLLTFEGGRFASSYRVKDGQITVVNRASRARDMTILVLENDRNSEGKSLPRSYLVQYWDAAKGTLDRVETVQERWRRFEAWDLPVSHVTTTARAGGLGMRSVVLSGHKLRPGP